MYYLGPVIELQFFTADDGKEQDVGIKKYFSADELQSSTEVIETTEPYLIGEGIWTTGEVPRTNDFEKLTGNLTKVHTIKDGEKIPDEIEDDLSLIFQLKDGSVIILAGCCHFGIANTMNHATTITGTSSIVAVAGGLHLYNASKERLTKTIEHLKGFPLSHNLGTMPLYWSSWTGRTHVRIRGYLQRNRCRFNSQVQIKLVL